MRGGKGGKGTGLRKHATHRTHRTRAPFTHAIHDRLQCNTEATFFELKHVFLQGACRSIGPAKDFALVLLFFRTAREEQGISLSGHHKGGGSCFAIHKLYLQTSLSSMQPCFKSSRLVSLMCSSIACGLQPRHCMSAETTSSTELWLLLTPNVTRFDDKSSSRLHMIPSVTWQR